MSKLKYLCLLENLRNICNTYFKIFRLLDKKLIGRVYKKLIVWDNSTDRIKEK